MWMAEGSPACGVPLCAHGVQCVEDQAAKAPAQHVPHRVQVLQHQSGTQQVHQADRASNTGFVARQF